MDKNGHRRPVLQNLVPFDSMMTHAADPHDGLELLVMRERMRSWRFYDHLRTDVDAPARRPRIGTRTTALASDGADLAAALRTILEIGDGNALASAIDDAFPGARIEIAANDAGVFSIEMHQLGLLRPLQVSELSDGTLRFLLLAAALLSPRPAPLLVLNEPETSLHPSLLEPLARLIAHAAADTQVIVVSHARFLVDALTGIPGCCRHDLFKELGETHSNHSGTPRWAWPQR